MQLTDVQPTSLRLPECAIPRPGDEVTWYADAHQVTGRLTGHNSLGEAIIITRFGNGTSKAYDEIRLADPFKRERPNWFTLPRGGRLLKPSESTQLTLQKLLSRRIPPGPSYMALVNEIWSRGFEVYLVGGTVRDAICDASPNDVDLVTTMPLLKAKQFLQSMYRRAPGGQPERGFIRLGGTPQSGDPFIDLKVFADSLIGTQEATFGVGFDRDVAHRDFACNSLYYDPVNNVIIDPTGQGVIDSRNKVLSLICKTDSPFQLAQIFIRAVKFINRGFTMTAETETALRSRCVDCLGCMKKSIRLRYFSAQVLSKHSTAEEKRAAVESFKAQLEMFGVTIWHEYFGVEIEALVDGK